MQPTGLDAIIEKDLAGEESWMDEEKKIVREKTHNERVRF
jgi:hypothetical protein